MVKRNIRTFVLVRDEDESGVSGTGVIAEGVEFTCGEVVLKWTTQCQTTGIYTSIKSCEGIHGHGGKTRIVWDGESTS